MSGGELQNQVALVTGASRGLGAAIAAELGRRGGRLIGTATTPEGVERMIERWREQGVRGVGRVLDVSLPESVRELGAWLRAEGLAPTILVNNAGINRDGLLARMSEEDWAAVLETDLTSVYRLSRLCLRFMLKARYGRIINISSVIGEIGNPGQCNYAAAKAGILGFSMALAREVAARNITVNVVTPGFIRSDMSASLSREQQEQILARVPLGRLGEPEEVASAVAFLAAPGAAYITGGILRVNGGLHMA